MSKPIPVWAAGKVVGEVEGTVFVKNVRGSRHKLRATEAWALDVTSLIYASSHGALSVELTDTETGTVYRVTVCRLWIRGERIDLGHGAQIALPLDMWEQEAKSCQMKLI